jgi:DNA-directed RNA polymerase subunit M/transcription elongation factor TFIIS
MECQECGGLMYPVRQVGTSEGLPLWLFECDRCGATWRRIDEDGDYSE